MWKRKCIWVYLSFMLAPSLLLSWYVHWRGLVCATCCCQHIQHNIVTPGIPQSPHLATAPHPQTIVTLFVFANRRQPNATPKCVAWRCPQCTLHQLDVGVAATTWHLQEQKQQHQHNHSHHNQQVPSQSSFYPNQQSNKTLLVEWRLFMECECESSKERKTIRKMFQKC